MANELINKGAYSQNNDGTGFLGAEGAAIDMQVAGRILRQSYAFMALALLVSGVVGYYFAANQAIIQSLLQMGTLGFWLVLIAQLVVVWYLSAKINELSVSAALGWFLAYAALTGVTFAFYLLIYTGESVVSIFLISSGIFALCSGYGYFTNKNIMGWGNWLFVGLIGVIISSIINMFMKSELLMYGLSALVVLLFCGLTAYDTQKLLVLSTTATSKEDEGRVAVLGALNLYLDFINLFLALLRLFGKRR